MKKGLFGQELSVVEQYLEKYRGNFGELLFFQLSDADREYIEKEMARVLAGERDPITDRELGAPSGNKTDY